MRKLLSLLMLLSICIGAAQASANVLTATLNGPMTPLIVINNDIGPTGDGFILADVTLEAAGSNWSVTQLTFHASTVVSAGDHDTAFSELRLYQSTSGGYWDPIQDSMVAPPAVFSGGAASFLLASTSLGSGSSARYFLTGLLNGTATTGQTFGASLNSVQAISGLPSGVISGVPTAQTSALLIDSPLLVVRTDTSQPIASYWHNAGEARSHLVGNFLLEAFNAEVTVNGMTLTASGTGNWSADLDATVGIQIYLDDGDGSLDDTADQLLYQGGGNDLNTMFVTPVIVPNNEARRLWVRIGLTPVAGMGLSSAPVTYQLEVAQGSDVNANATVFLGSAFPRTATLGAIEFRVDTFDPLVSFAHGGRSITMFGSGFVQPLRVRIDGVVCPGTAVISASGTTVTGLSIPPGGGGNREVPIVVESGKLPPQQLTVMFKYYDPFIAVSFSPLTDDVQGGEPITIEGSGFVLPLQVWIGDELCPGSPQIDATGSVVTGLFVPPAAPGPLNNLPIRIQIDDIPPEIQSFTFTYSSGSGSGDGGGSGSDSGCSRVSPTFRLQLLALLALAPAVLLRRGRLRHVN
jgi:hypothetical protein